VTLHERLTGGPVSGCTLCVYIDTLPADEQAEWNKELGLPVTVVGNTAVVNELARVKIATSETSVRRHRTRHVTH
jgi:hypothetical protein